MLKAGKSQRSGNGTLPRFPDVTEKGLMVKNMTVQKFKELLNEAADEAVRQMKYAYGVDRDNPVEVWTRTDGILDAVIRRNLRGRLIEEGRNPFTGKVEKV